MREKLTNRIIVVLSSLVVITMPIKNSFNSVAIILFVLSCLVILVMQRDKIKFKLFSKKVLILIVPFLFLIIQGLYSDYPTYVKNLQRGLPLFLFPIVLNGVTNIISKKEANRILNIFLWSALSYSVILLGVAFYRQICYMPDFSKVNWYFFTYYDFTEFLGIHPTYMGMYVCMSIAVTIENLSTHRKNGLINICSIIFLSVIIFLLGSRISLVCWSIIIFYGIISNYKKLDKIKRQLILLFLLVLPLSIFTLVPIVKERMIDMTLGIKDQFQYAKYGKNIKYNGGINPRLEIWDCAMQVGKNQIIFGNGYGNTQGLLNECYREKGLNEYANKNYQTHNQYFNHFARGGIMGLAILLLIYVYSFYWAMKSRSFMHASFIIIIIITSLTENILNLHTGIVFFAFFNSFFIFINHKKY